MTVAQLVTRRQFRGAEVSASRLSEGLAAQGHRVYFAGLYSPPDQDLRADGAINTDLSDKNQGFFSLKLLRAMIRFFNEQRFDIVQANGSDTLKYAVSARIFARHKPKLVYRNISVMSTWVGKSLLRKMMNKFLLQKVDFITSVGNEAMADLINHFSVAANKIAVVKRGIHFETLSKERARAEHCLEFGIPPESKILIHIGHFSPEKNHAFLLASFALISKKIPGACLLLAGDGNLKKSMMEKAELMGLRNVFFLGLRKDTPSLLAASDVLVLTSTIEGVPGVVLEAAAQKTPSLAVNVGGVSEVIHHGDTGLLVNNHSSGEFADAVCEILNNTAERERLGLRAYHFVKQHYSQEVALSAIIKLYGRIINGENFPAAITN